jgi:hypothetical protein
MDIYMYIHTYIVIPTKQLFQTKGQGLAHMLLSKENRLIILIACSEAGFFFQTLLIMHCAISQKVAGSITDGATGIFH